jgi:hypothetical protein
MLQYDTPCGAHTACLLFFSCWGGVHSLNVHVHRPHSLLAARALLQLLAVGPCRHAATGCGFVHCSLAWALLLWPSAGLTLIFGAEQRGRGDLFVRFLMRGSPCRTYLHQLWSVVSVTGEVCASACAHMAHTPHTHAFDG